jgi:hypothetical protein
MQAVRLKPTAGGWFAGALALALAAAVVIAIQPDANAASAPTWNGVLAMPSGSSFTLPSGTPPSEVVTSPTGASFLYFDYNGYPALAQFGAGGALGTPVPVPQSVTFGSDFYALGPVDFLPNGDAIVSWSPTGGVTLAYRFASGTYGPAMDFVSGVLGFAARAGELLVLTQNGDAVDATSYSIGADGSFTQVGSPAQIYDDTTEYPYIAAAFVTLDANGQAEALIDDSGTPPSPNGVFDVVRSASGQWGNPTELSSDGVDRFTAAGAPGGGAIAMWVAETTTAYQFWYSVRSPGGTFGAPVMDDTVSAPAGGNVAFNPPMTAAGPDGTLAAAYQPEVCPSSGQVLMQSAIHLVLVTPSGGAGDSIVPDSTWAGTTSEGSNTSLSALGVGDDEAIVGFDGQSSTDAPEGDCNNPSSSSPSTIDYNAYASILGGTDSSGTAELGSVSYASQGGNPPTITLGAVGLDTAGNAAVMGSITQSSATQYETFGSPGTATTTPTTTTTTPTTTTTTPAPTTTTTTPTPATTTPTSTTPITTTTRTTTTPSTTTTQTTPTIENLPAPNAGRIGPSGIVSGDYQILSLENANSYGIAASIQMVISLGGGSLVARAGTKAKAETIASATVSIAAHKTAKPKLKLSKAGLKLLHKHHKLKATLKITLTAQGHLSKTLQQAITLRT